MKKGDLVYIKWEDSLGCPRGWEDLATARSTACSTIESVGWVMRVGKRTVQVAPHVSSVKGQAGGGVQGYICIPLSAILKSRELQV